MRGRPLSCVCRLHFDLAAPVAPWPLIQRTVIVVLSLGWGREAATPPRRAKIAHTAQALDRAKGGPQCSLCYMPLSSYTPAGKTCRRAGVQAKSTRRDKRHGKHGNAVRNISTRPIIILKDPWPTSSQLSAHDSPPFWALSLLVLSVHHWFLTPCTGIQEYDERKKKKPPNLQGSSNVHDTRKPTAHPQGMQSRLVASLLVCCNHSRSQQKRQRHSMSLSFCAFRIPAVAEQEPCAAIHPALASVTKQKARPSLSQERRAWGLGGGA